MNNQLIQSHPNIMMGKPVVAGTRITVELLLEKLAAGESVDQLLDALESPDEPRAAPSVPQVVQA